jgi:LPPG:FO 2-phospho-L-lactate transferase
MREALRESPAPVVGVSPLVRGEVLKGPTAAFMTWAGHWLDAAGIAAAYEGVIDALVCDEDVTGLSIPVLRTDTLMDGEAGRARLAREALDLALGVAA